MRYLLALSLLCVACEKKTECDKRYRDYIKVQPENVIADMASASMAKECGGPYNIEEIRENEKHKTYVFTCPNHCR